VTTPTDLKLSQRPSRIRMDACLDSVTRHKVEELARQFRRPRAAVLYHIMEWGLSRAQTPPPDQGASHGPVCHLYLDVAADLHARVENAAAAAGVNIAPWLRHMVRQITMADFPGSWQEVRSEERSHASRIYSTRFMLRLDKPSHTKLQQFVKQFGASKAEVIRRLIAQANEKDFPKNWQMKAAEHRLRTRNTGY
jgi:hypothetical protein